MPVTFIGDVHGWSDRLERVAAQAEGEIVLMGDLIDRGPDAPGVLRFARELDESGRGRCLLGNHEYALIRALGYEPLGVVEEPAFFGAWRDGFGGIAVLEAYGVEDAAGLRAAMGSTLDWLARRPWVLQGGEGESRWIAVHGGLQEERALGDQLAELALGWAGPEDNAEALFSKARMLTLPLDLPERTCVVSGHVPLPKAHVCPTRILCDTSGGQRHRQLSGVIWPSGTIINSGDGV